MLNSTVKFNRIHHLKVTNGSRLRHLGNEFSKCFQVMFPEISGNFITVRLPGHDARFSHAWCCMRHQRMSFSLPKAIGMPET
jgi:hypothetical protein